MTDTASDSEPGRAAVMPPYTSFQSLKSFLQVLREHGVPARIDRSVMGNKFSGAVVTQILTALKFLRLIGTDGAPSDELRGLISSLDTENWPDRLAAVLRAGYVQVFELDLEKVTASQFAERFREAYKAEGETGRKCTTFFLHAAREAKVPVSPYLMVNAKPRASSGKRKQRGGGAARSASQEDQSTRSTESSSRTDPPLPQPDLSAVAVQLLEKFPKFDPKWSPEIQAKWFEGYEKLLGMNTK